MRRRARPWGSAGTCGGRSSRCSPGTVAARPFQLRERCFLSPEVSPRQRRALPGSARGRVPPALVPPGGVGSAASRPCRGSGTLAPAGLRRGRPARGWVGAGLHLRGIREPSETPGRGAGGGEVWECPGAGTGARLAGRGELPRCSRPWERLNARAGGRGQGRRRVT